MVILLLIFAVAGTVYVFIVDRNSKNGGVASYKVPVEKNPLPKAVPPAANAAEGVAIETLSSPVAPGDNVTASARTNAGSSCVISVLYNGVAATDSGLAAKKADAYGDVEWTWSVPASTPVGSWPVKVTCVYNGRTGLMVQNLDVSKS